MTQATNSIFKANGEAIQLGKVLGKGGEGTVYEISGANSQFVAKIYNKPIDIDKKNKLHYMTSFRTNGVESVSAWPIETIHTTSDKSISSICGFVMRKIVECQPIHTLFSANDRKQHFPKMSWDYLVLVARNLASAVSKMHENNCIVGDLNESNILVNPKNATISLIDCDSYQVEKGNQLFLCTVGVGLYLPPELQKRDLKAAKRNVESDNFALAIFIFRLLFMGRHPFSGTYTGNANPPTIEESIANYLYFFSSHVANKVSKIPPGIPDLSLVNKQCQDLFELAFVKAPSIRRARPNAHEWIAALDDIRNKLTKCKKNNSHLIYQSSGGCHWCKIEEKFNIFHFSAPTNRDELSDHHIKYLEDKLNAFTKYNLNLELPWHKEYELPRLSKALTPKKLPKEVEEQLKKPRKSILSKIRLKLFLSILFTFSVILISLNYYITPIGNEVLTMGILSVFIFYPHLDSIIVSNPYIMIKSYREEYRIRKKLLAKSNMEYNAIFSSYQNKRGELNKLIYSAKVYNSNLQGLSTELAPLIQVCKGLLSQYRDALRDYRQNVDAVLKIKKCRSMIEYLKGFQLMQTRFAGFPSEVRSELWNQGILTAADLIEDKLLKIRGIGPVRCNALLMWRQQLENEYVTNTSPQVISSKLQSLQKRYLNQIDTFKKQFNQSEVCIKKLLRNKESERNKLGALNKQAIDELVSLEKALNSKLEMINQLETDLMIFK